MRESAKSAERDPASTAFRLPNVLVIGVPKGGTTWFFHMLRQHPDVFVSGQNDVEVRADLKTYVPDAKEPHFFDSVRRMSELGVDGYARTYFRDARDERIVVDNSGSYWMVAPDAPRHLLTPRGDWPKDLPGTIEGVLGTDLRFIVALRDPTERLISWAFQHKKIFPHRTGKEILEVQALWGQLYFGFYHHHLSRWFERFDPSRFFVTIMEEDLRMDAARTVERLVRFLGVDPYPFAGIDERYNVRQTWRREGDDYLIQKPVSNKRRVLFGRRAAEWEVFIDAASVARVRELYRDVPEQTGRLLGRDLSSVWGG